MHNQRGSVILVSVLITIIIAAGAWYFFMYRRPVATNTNTTNTSNITSYDDCVAAGYPVLESYPTRCATPDGRSFTQYIGNELEKADMITITAPRPNATVTSPLSITGTARGSWFFEGVFPVTLTDAQGIVVATGQAHAQGDWMTDAFVSYTAELTYTTAPSGNGTLTLAKDNPSGLEENDDALIVPVVFTPLE